MTDFWIDCLGWICEKIILPFIVVGMALFIISVPFLIYACHQEQKRPTFELKKDDWSCSREHEYVTTTMVMVGKVMVPQTITHHDCIQWSHK